MPCRSVDSDQPLSTSRFRSPRQTPLLEPLSQRSVSPAESMQYSGLDASADFSRGPLVPIATSHATSSSSLQSARSVQILSTQPEDLASPRRTESPRCSPRCSPRAGQDEPPMSYRRIAQGGKTDRRMSALDETKEVAFTPGLAKFESEESCIPLSSVPSKAEKYKEDINPTQDGM